MIITINNIKEILRAKNPIHKSRVYGSNRINHYKLVEPLEIKLTNGVIIKIPKDFKWDLASVPRVLWSVCSPDNDAEIAYLIHDYLYRYNVLPKKECDLEMYKWAKEVNSTYKISIKNIDNILRYLAVKFFGEKSYNNGL
jgi:hypothetical protein